MMDGKRRRLEDQKDVPQTVAPLVELAALAVAMHATLDRDLLTMVLPEGLRERLQRHMPLDRDDDDDDDGAPLLPTEMWVKILMTLRGLYERDIEWYREGIMAGHRTIWVCPQDMPADGSPPRFYRKHEHYDDEGRLHGEQIEYGREGWLPMRRQVFEHGRLVDE